jgi:hypothetical protein
MAPIPVMRTRQICDALLWLYRKVCLLQGRLAPQSLRHRPVSPSHTPHWPPGLITVTLNSKKPAGLDRCLAAQPNIVLPSPTYPRWMYISYHTTSYPTERPKAYPSPSPSPSSSHPWNPGSLDELPENRAEHVFANLITMPACFSLAPPCSTVRCLR